MHTREGGSFFDKSQTQDFFQPVAKKDTPFVQTKLTVNKPGDKFEQEADKMADKVVRTPAPMVKDEKMFASPPKALIQKAEMKEEKVQKADLKEEKVQKAEAKEEKIQKAEIKDDKVQKAEVKEEKVQKADIKDEKVKKAEAKDEKLQRKESSGGGGMTGATQSAIQSQKAGGAPLSNDVRSYMEPRFGADFSNVRIHNDQESASLNNQLSARAFTYQNHVFFSRDQYQPGTSEGKHLLAHELTHTIQQGHSNQHAANVSTTASPPPIQRLGIQDALDKFAEWAYNIPGFRLLTIVLGFNPVNMRNTDRSAANILRGLIELIPGGHFITQALDNHGVINKAATWVEQKISALGDIGSEITGGLKRFMDSLSWRDIFDLGGVWDRAKAIFTGPIGRLISFGGSVVSELLKMVKDAILKPLAALAEGTAGYDLLKAVLGQDPITGEPVPRNAETLIGGFMKLIGQQEVWENIKKGNAVSRAWAWFQGALSGLMGFVRSIPGKIVATLRSLTFMDIVTVAGAFIKIGSAFLNIAGEFISWAGAQVISLLEIIFSVVAPGAVPYIKKAQGAFQKIIKDPIGFVGNLVRAGKLGFQMFASNILTHLKTALIKWITGPLGDAGVYIPKSFTLIEIVKLVLSVLGLTWQNIRSKLVKIIPEPVLVVLEKTASILVTLVKDGPAAAWQEIKTELTELKDQMIAKVTEMITVEVVKAAVMKLVSMLNPAGAVIQAIIAIYNTITFFIQKINQIAAVVGAFIDSIAAISAGQIAAAAKKVEQTMANTLTIIIAFLAKFAGLGNIPEKVVGIIKKIRQPIDKGLDKIVGWLGGLLKKLTSSVAQAGLPQDPNERLRLGLQAAVTATRSLGKINESLIKPVLVGIKTRYGFQFIEPFKRNNTWWIKGKINPGPNELDTGKGDVESSDERIVKMDNGSMSEEARKALLNSVTGIIGNGTVIENFFKLMKGQELVNLLEQIKSLDLKSGFKIVSKPQGPKMLFMSYHGLFDAGSRVKYGTVKIGLRWGDRKHLGIAQLSGELLKLDFNVDGKIKRLGIKGVGTEMMKIAQDYFAGQYTTIEGLWVYNPSLYRNPKGESENLTKFWFLKDGGSSKEDAAFGTFTGKAVKAQQYDVVTFKSMTRTEVQVVFSKSTIVTAD